MEINGRPLDPTRALDGRPERVVLVGLHWDESTISIDESLEELRQLARTAGAEVVQIFRQNLAKPNPATFIGPGKVEEIASFVKENPVDAALFDENLSPAQQKKLEEAIGRKIVDRTGLILDIFAMHAHSNEGKLQVELAQLEYTLPRLTRMWTHLSRQAGGIGTRGPGEQQLEVDRRRIRHRIQHLRRELEKYRHHRERQRERRRGIPVPVVSLVGYTNAGKSTLLQRLTGADVVAEDKLFVTLDTLLRRTTLPNGLNVIFSDTVGFIRKLPHQLVASFRATLEEIRDADLLLHCIDGSDPSLEPKRKAVYDVLAEIGAREKPIVEVYNKLDRLGGDGTGRETPGPLAEPDGAIRRVGISALTGEGIEQLLHAIEAELERFSEELELRIPYTDRDALDRVRAEATVVREEYEAEAVRLTARIARSRSGPLLPYRVSDGG